MPDQLIAIDGTNFILSDRQGDINQGVDGVYVRDTRYVSRWQLRLGGRKPDLLTSHHVDPFSNLAFLKNADDADLPPHSVSLLRRRVVGTGLDEEFELSNHLGRELNSVLRLEIDSDFLDLFEVKALEFANVEDQVFAGAAKRLVTRAPVDVAVAGQPFLRMSHEDGAYSGSVDFSADQPPDIVDETGVAWNISIGPLGSIRIRVHVNITVQGQPLGRTRTFSDFGKGAEALLSGPDVGSIGVPRVRTSWDKLHRAYNRAVNDLGSLLINDPSLAAGLPAAGLPWFMTVFGRDTLITSYQVLPGGQWLGWGALKTLAALQADHDDPQRDAEPGKIVHELRRGPVAINDGSFPYYGTVDAPMLFLVLLHELWHWTGDDDQVRELWPAALRILEWMDGPADVDGDGFIEWRRRSSKGLDNQAWKDSWDANRYHDGRIAKGPIASSEVQGYAYDAWRRTAELAREVIGDAALGDRLEARARRMHEDFNRSFWSDQRGGFYALALDGRKQHVDSITSNMGHLLWSGIVPDERAGQVVEQLMGPGLFSGWGIRTMSTADDGYNPISYHCGTVWPHDNSIAAMGLRRYGYHDEANRLWTAMMDASQNFIDSRLPEVFAGYSREIGPFPVQYPTTCSPQAWAAGAVILMLRAALGAEPDRVSRMVNIDPHLPEFVRTLGMYGCRIYGRHYDLLVADGETTVNEVDGKLPLSEYSPVTG